MIIRIASGKGDTGKTSLAPPVRNKKIR